jgi:hypothetical protein
VCPDKRQLQEQHFVQRYAKRPHVFFLRRRQRSLISFII